MKKIRNDKEVYLSRSILAQSSVLTKGKAKERKDPGDFKIDSAGYFAWAKKRKTFAV